MSFFKKKLSSIAKYLAFGFVIYCLLWMVAITEWKPEESAKVLETRTKSSVYETSATTMRTIIAYSERKLAEMNRPLPVSCDQIPAIPSMNTNEDPNQDDWESPKYGWQEVKGTDVFLYSAYYDNRIEGQPYIRILGRFFGRQWGNRPQLYCQTRSQNPLEMDMEVVAAVPIEIWWHEWDTLSNETETPVLLSCALSDEFRGDYFVSVVRDPCDDPTNLFEITSYDNEEENTVNFTVCIKDLKLDNNDNYLPIIIEWIELNRVLGAETIDIYIDDINSEIESVLNYYRKNSLVRMYRAPIKSKNGRQLWQRRRDHIISYNDCLYRNLRRSKFIIPIDIDEIILPKTVDSWNKLVDMLYSFGWNEDIHSAILIRNVFFFDFLQDRFSGFKALRKHLKVQNEIETNIDLEDEYKYRCHTDDIPGSKYMNNVIRSTIVSPKGHYSKSLMLTKKVLTVFNHYPLSSLGASKFGIWAAPFEEVQMNHYKVSCNSTLVRECSEYSKKVTVDASVWRFHNQLTTALLKGPCIQY